MLPSNSSPLVAPAMKPLFALDAVQLRPLFVADRPFFTYGPMSVESAFRNCFRSSSCSLALLKTSRLPPNALNADSILLNAFSTALLASSEFVPRSAMFLATPALFDASSSMPLRNFTCESARSLAFEAIFSWASPIFCSEPRPSFIVLTAEVLASCALVHADESCSRMTFPISTAFFRSDSS
jgi:hypothetical protein